MAIQGLIFDLEGVLCDTNKFHYRAWRKLANQLDFEFTQEQHESFNRLSLRDSMHELLKIGKITLPEDEKLHFMELKNEWYIEYVQTMTPNDILPGVVDFVIKTDQAGYKLALGSYSKNAKKILQQLQLSHRFSCVVDGTMVMRSKPHPEIFEKISQFLELNPKELVAFEDNPEGVKAAKNGKFKSIGVGDKEGLQEADHIIPGFKEFSFEEFESIVQEF